MSLFKNITEVKSFVPLTSGIDFNDLLPFIKQAERDFIIPIISQAQFDSLNSWYNAGTPPATHTANERLLDKVQAALSLYALYFWIPSGQLQVGASGIRIATTETLKTAFQWQINEFRTNTLRQAGSAVEDLLNTMEANKGDYVVWVSSDQYTRFKNFFVSSVDKFAEFYPAIGSSHINFMKVKTFMQQVEEFTIQSELSPDFYSALKAQHVANTLSVANAKLIPMIQKVVVNLTMQRALTQLSVIIGENGIFNFNNTGARETIEQVEPAQKQMITKLEYQAGVDGLAYLKVLKDFLKNNIADYPTYASSTAYDSETTDNHFKNDDTQTGYVAMV